VRAGSRVERTRFDALEPALTELETRAGELARGEHPGAVDLKLAKYSPGQQVVGRLELSGPERRLARVHAGVDVRGDGSTEAYLGRVSRRPLEPGDNGSALDALRRALLDR
jgi:hypothetical protein